MITIPTGNKDPTKLGNHQLISHEDYMNRFAKLFEVLLKYVVQSFTKEKYFSALSKFGFQCKLAALQQVAVAIFDP